jgi:hypothetical protein
MNEPRIFLGSSGEQAFRVRPGRPDHERCVPVRAGVAYALLGNGRCLHPLGDPAAEQPLTQARELFAAMGYQAALAETQTLLEQRELAAP